MFAGCMLVTSTLSMICEPAFLSSSMKLVGILSTPFKIYDKKAKPILFTHFSRMTQARVLD
jgi:hypothetical protein